jgi:hypothetical protein
MISPLSATPQQDARDIVQALLNAPGLSKYYHFDARPERAPLKVVNRTGVDLGTRELAAAGKQALIVAVGDKSSLEVNALSVSADKAEVSFAFAVEGISGDARFTRSRGGWSLTGMKIREH